jgi:hypothetical protein
MGSRIFLENSTLTFPRGQPMISEKCSEARPGEDSLCQEERPAFGILCGEILSFANLHVYLIPISFSSSFLLLKNTNPLYLEIPVYFTFGVSR